MTKNIKPIPKEELDAARRWLHGQAEAGNVSPEDYAVVILHKLFELEERLKKIEFNQQTHLCNRIVE